MTTKYFLRYRQALALLCTILLFMAVLPLSAYAESFTVSTVYGTAYFQTYNSQGQWVPIGTPQHYIVETGQPVFCIQTEKASPQNAAYAEVSGESVFDIYEIRRGIEIIMQYGYPTTTGGFSDDEARYATANAIRFFLVDCGEDYVPSWMNLDWYGEFFRPVPGFEDLWEWCLELRYLANHQASVSRKTHAISLSTNNLNLSANGEYFVGEVTVSLTGCEGGYRLDSTSLPEGASVSGYTGKNGDKLTILIPKNYSNGSYSLKLIGSGYKDDGDVHYYAPYNSSLQKVVTYVAADFGSLSDVANAQLNISTPEAQTETGSLKIQKVDKDTRVPLANAGFRVYDAEMNVVEEKYTDDTGTVIFENLPVGVYSYQEFAAPEGYKLDMTECCFDITQAGEIYESVMTNKRNDVRSGISIHKRDVRGNGLMGAVFKLEKSTDSGITWELIDSYTSDESGDIVIPDLIADGNIGYRVTETSTAPGYILHSEPIFTGSLADYGNAELSLTICNCPNITMPFTGGEGFYHIYTITGLMIFMGLIFLKRRYANEEN